MLIGAGLVGHGVWVGHTVLIGAGLVGRSVWVATTNCIVASTEVGDGWGVVVLEGVAIVLILRLICVLVAVGVAVGRRHSYEGVGGRWRNVNRVKRRGL